jgi:hypothetical protein
MINRSFNISDCFIYINDYFGILRLEDVDKSFEIISQTRIDHIIEVVKKHGYSIDWGGEFIAWDKTIYDINSIYHIIASHSMYKGSHSRKIYLDKFRSVCRNWKLKEIGIQ